jgi:hypothetical protein
MPADRGGRAVRPGACDQRPSGRGIPGCGNRPLLAPRTRGRRRREHAQALHERSGSLKARQGAAFRHGGDRTSALHAPQGLAGLDHRVQAPRLHVSWPCLFKTLEAFGVFGHGTDICLQDAVLRRGRADHCREPPERGGAPGGPSRVADIVSE